MQDPYRDLGIEPVINAAGTLTGYGGSLMWPEAAEAMAAASRHFVVMEELHLAAGQHIAQRIGVPAAHICAGAAAGIALMAAACMTGTDRHKIALLPKTDSLKNRFVVQTVHRNGFDQALRLVGGEFVEIGANADELLRALNADVAGVYYTIAWFCPGDALPLAQVAEIAHRAGIPVIVDAAAEIPPPENLSRFVREGADLVTFSGGKGIRGPQSSGLILGRADLVEACRLNDNPNMAIGRPMKVGKEEIVGLVKAVELYLAQDHGSVMALWEHRVACILNELAPLQCVRAWRQMPGGPGQLVPHVALTWDEEALGLTHAECARKLLSGSPRIAVQVVDPLIYGPACAAPQIRIHPHTLCAGEELVVARRIREVLGESGG